MKKFIKLNLLAFLYGFALFIETELMLNCYRLYRITHWFNFTVDKIAEIVLFIIFTFIFFYITFRHFNTGALKYILTILWIPYYVVLLILFVYLLPITNPQDEPLGALGFVLFGLWIIYPIYIAIISFICTKNRFKDFEQ
jgi:hypothetical protein